MIPSWAWGREQQAAWFKMALNCRASGVESESQWKTNRVWIQQGRQRQIHVPEVSNRAKASPFLPSWIGYLPCCAVHIGLCSPLQCKVCVPLYWKVDSPFCPVMCHGPAVVVLELVPWHCSHSNSTSSTWTDCYCYHELQQTVNETGMYHTPWDVQSSCTDCIPIPIPIPIPIALVPILDGMVGILSSLDWDELHRDL
jgi:hypothetical protein